MGLQRVRHNWATKHAHACTKNTTERKSRSSPFRKSPMRAYRIKEIFVVVIQLLSHVQLFATPWTAARQASLSFTVSQSFLKHHVHCDAIQTQTRTHTHPYAYTHVCAHIHTREWSKYHLVIYSLYEDWNPWDSRNPQTFPELLIQPDPFTGGQN